MGPHTYLHFQVLHFDPEDFQTKGSESSHTITVSLAGLVLSLGTI